MPDDTQEPTYDVEFPGWWVLEDIGAGDGVPTECECCGKSGTPRQQAAVGGELGLVGYAEFAWVDGNIATVSSRRGSRRAILVAPAQSAEVTSCLPSL